MRYHYIEKKLNKVQSSPPQTLRNRIIKIEFAYDDRYICFKDLTFYMKSIF